MSEIRAKERPHHAPHSRATHHETQAAQQTQAAGRTHTRITPVPWGKAATALYSLTPRPAVVAAAAAPATTQSRLRAIGAR